MDNATSIDEIAELERRLAQLRAGLPAKQAPQPDDQTISPRQDRSRAHMSFMQEQLWFLDQLTPGLPTYNLSAFVRLTGRLDVAAMQRAISAAIARHETLRTTFAIEDGAATQIIHPPTAAELPVIDLPVAQGEDREAALIRTLEAQTMEPFRLDHDRPFRLRLFRVEPDQHVLALTVHHICFDGGSASVLMAEIAEMYGQAASGKDPQLPELPIQYADVAEWQQRRLETGALERDVAYWGKRLTNYTTLELPTDRPRPDFPSFKGDRVDHAMSREVLEGVRGLARKTNSTLFAVLVAGMSATLSRLSGIDDVVIGTANANRQRAEFQNLVGCLINMLVLRNDLSDDPTFEDLIRRSMLTIAEAWEHQAAPFEKIIERLDMPRDPSRNPIFQVAMDLQPRSSFVWNFAGLESELVSVVQPTARFDIAVNSYEGEDGLEFRVEFATDLFDRSRVVRLMGQFEQVLRCVVADAGVRVSRLPLVSGVELDRMLVQWQGVVVEQSCEPVHVQIAAVAARTPLVVAARLEGAQLTYGELDARAGLLARRLRQLGVGREDVVGVVLDRGFDLLVALVGVLKAGAAFVVMDATHPPQRLAFVLSDTAAKVVLTSEGLRGRLPRSQGWVPVCLDSDWASVRASSSVGLPEWADEAALAYVLYTSGSTGKPKGVMIEHHALTTFTVWLRGQFGFGPGVRMAHHMAMIFDFAIGEIFTALVSGATLVFVPEQARLSPEVFGELLVRERIDYLGGPPAVLGGLGHRPYPDLKFMIAGGEAVPADLVNQWNVAPRRFVNGYGPTEAAVGCVFYECDYRVWTGQPPIGRAMPNRYAYVLDRWDNLCPVGVPGEIVVGGAGLARGYLNLAELTAQKFVADPVRAGGRLYRTGDLGVWNEAGQIEFLGRIDTQIKLNGLRIELEEIESTLTTHPQVVAAAVTVREDTPGNKQLVGYVVPDNGTVDIANLREHLADNLPRYMIPNVFVTLATLPLTSVGKIDRAALPHPGQDTAPARAPRLPTTPTEQAVAETFAEILDLQHVSIDDNFFALGGNSLQAARAVIALRERVQQEVALTLLYTKPTIRELAAALNETETLTATSAGSAAAAVVELELPPRSSQRFARVLLTGATGYFGAFLLDELLMSTNAVVCCLVRAKDDAEAWAKLHANLARFDRDRDDLEDRVWILRGDLAQPQMGLSNAEFARQSKAFDTVVHCAAHVDILFPYEHLEAVNVGGTRSVIDFATAGTLKELLFVSTVSARYGESRDPTIPGYATTKWDAERAVESARKQGVPASIYRLPRIAGDTRTGRSNDRDAVMGMVRRFLGMGIAPEFDFAEEWVPADEAARLMISTALNHPDGGLFNIDPPARVEIRKLIGLLAERAGLPMLPPLEFMEHITARFPDQSELMRGILATGGKQLATPSEQVDAGFVRVESCSVDVAMLRKFVEAAVIAAGKRTATAT